MQASKLPLPPSPPSSLLLHLPTTTSSSSSSSSTTISSAVVDVASHSLALIHSDSSILLYSLTSPTSPPPPPLPIPPPISTSISFLRLLPSSHLLFLALSPSPSGTLLRCWIRSRNAFLPQKVAYGGGRGEYGVVVVGLRHGFGVRVDGSVNFFAVYSCAEREIWMFGARMRGGGDGCVELVKCAVVRCSLPVYDVRILDGFLFLGEAGGVRVFPLRALVKGRRRSGDKVDKDKRLPNGVVVTGAIDVGRKRAGSTGGKCNGEGGKKMDDRTVAEDHSAIDKSVTLRRGKSGGDKVKRKEEDKRLPNGVVTEAVDVGRKPAGSTSGKCNGEGEKMESDVIGDGTVTEDRSSTKLRMVKLRQDSGDLGSFFVEFKSTEVQVPGIKTGVMTCIKAVSVHALSLKRFLILDSVGHVHLMHMHHTSLDSEGVSHNHPSPMGAKMRPLHCTLNVQILAVLPNTPSRKQSVWMSDASHSLHVVSLTNMDNNENNSDESREKSTEVSVDEAVFTSEKIHGLVPFSASSVLAVDRGNVFLYAV